MSINLTAQQAADDLGIDLSLVERHCRNGRIVATKHGRAWVITATALHQYKRKGPLKAGRKKKAESE